jgi:hypothetical protein
VRERRKRGEGSERTVREGRRKGVVEEEKG